MQYTPLGHDPSDIQKCSPQPLRQHWQDRDQTFRRKPPPRISHPPAQLLIKFIIHLVSNPSSYLSGCIPTRPPIFSSPRAVGSLVAQIAYMSRAAKMPTKLRAVGTKTEVAKPVGMAPGRPPVWLASPLPVPVPPEVTAVPGRFWVAWPARILNCSRDRDELAAVLRVGG